MRHVWRIILGDLSNHVSPMQLQGAGMTNIFGHSILMENITNYKLEAQFLGSFTFVRPSHTSYAYKSERVIKPNQNQFAKPIARPLYVA